MATETWKVLRKGDVTERAAAARSLNRTGAFADIAELVTLAIEDRSPSVRLYTAAAAADIAARTASSAGRAQQKALVQSVLATDPGRNPSLLMVLAALPGPSVIPRLGRILRDPRSEVRSGAATALRRMALTEGDVSVHDALVDAFRGWLDAARHPPDAILEMVRIIGEAGLRGLESELQRAMTAGRPHGAAVGVALDQLRIRGEIEGYVGLWEGQGAPLMQPEPEGRTGWMLVGPDGSVGGGLHDGVALTPGGDGPRLGEIPVRLLFVARAGEEGLQSVLDMADGALWRCDGPKLVHALGEWGAEIDANPRASRHAAGLIADEEGGVAKRLRARFLWRGGELEAADAALDDLLTTKSPMAEVHWMSANVKVGLGDLDSARSAVARALKGAPKKCSWRAEAEALQVSLRG